MIDTIDKSPLMDRKTVAEYLGVSPQTLEKWTQTGRGPAYIRVGWLIRYRVSDLDTWIESQTVAASAG